MEEQRKIKENEEIIAYRVGDHFLCSEHYQRSVKILSVHEIDLPAKPIKKGDIDNFVCTMCEELIEDATREEEDHHDLQNKVYKAIKEVEDKKNYIQDMIKMTGEITKISRKAKFIRRTLHSVSKDRPLTRRNILNLRTFYDNLLGDLDAIQNMITCCFFDELDYNKLLAMQARRDFLTLSPREQKVLRLRFSLPEKCAYEQEHVGKEAAIIS